MGLQHVETFSSLATVCYRKKVRSATYENEFMKKDTYLYLNRILL